MGLLRKSKKDKAAKEPKQERQSTQKEYSLQSGKHRVSYNSNTAFISRESLNASNTPIYQRSSQPTPRPILRTERVRQVDTIQVGSRERRESRNRQISREDSRTRDFSREGSPEARDGPRVPVRTSSSHAHITDSADSAPSIESKKDDSVIDQASKFAKENPGLALSAVCAAAIAPAAVVGVAAYTLTTTAATWAVGTFAAAYLGKTMLDNNRAVHESDNEAAIEKSRFEAKKEQRNHETTVRAQQELMNQLLDRGKVDMVERFISQSPGTRTLTSGGGATRAIDYCDKSYSCACSKCVEANSRRGRKRIMQ